MIQLAPAQWIKIAKDPGRIVIPAPPQVAGQRPEPLLYGRYKTVERTGFTDDVRNPVRGLGELRNLTFRKDSRLERLQHQHPLQHTAIDQWNSEERLVGILAGFDEILKARMLPHLFHRYRTNLFRNQADQSFIHGHAQLAHAFRAQPQCRRQHQIGAVGLQQVGGTNIGAEAPCNQRDHVHQGFGRLSRLRSQVRDLIPRQHVVDVERAGHVVLFLN